MADFKYAGAELDLFAEVHNWKTYWSRSVRPFIHGDVLEVGAGIGSNTRYLDSGGHGRWVALEPDVELAGRLAENLAQIRGGRTYETTTVSIKDLDAVPQFDTLIYIDVLEHIENDREELVNAAKLLRTGGRIIVLSPAHQWLFTLFDATIGHFRRYPAAPVCAASLRVSLCWNGSFIWIPPVSHFPWQTSFSCTNRCRPGRNWRSGTAGQFLSLGFLTSAYSTPWENRL